MRLAIVSHSARIYAQLACAEGHQVLAIDAFADMDTRLAAEVCEWIPGLTALDEEAFSDLLAKLLAYQPEAVLIGSGFEHQPGYYQRLCAQLPVMGSQPAMVKQAGDPYWLSAWCAQQGVRRPLTVMHPEQDGGQWLCKQRGGAGGTHVYRHDAHAQQRPGEDDYYQAWQAGQAVGGLFVADQQGWRLIGVHALHHRPDSFAYAGASVLHDASLWQAMQALMDSLAVVLPLQGIGSVDALWHAGQLHVLEINPRLSASMRLYGDQPLIQAHLAACRQQPRIALLPPKGAASHCIVYARQSLDSRDCVFPDWVEDRPALPQIAAGQPLCSMFASGLDNQAVQATLLTKITALQQLWGSYVCDNIEFNIH